MQRVCPTCGTTYDEKSVFCPTDGSSLRTVDDGGGLIGSVIADRYLITEQLGEGGMGRVYLAQHVRLPQQAAIKVLHPALLHDTEALARFNREASNACQINHQHVARVYDFGEAGPGLIYLAMEYVPGQTLTALLEAAGPLSPQRAAALLRQIAAGLDAAHKLGIVHRDLKPDNILVVRDEDGTEQVKVVDFGIAKAMDSRTQGVTRTGLVIGTALYMSPEQVSGHVIDKRSDVYALGLVAFVLLTGVLPFPGDTAEEAMIRRLTERPLTLAEAAPDMSWPEGLQAVMNRALARDITERYPTASAFAAALTTAVTEWHHPTHEAAAPDSVVRAEAGVGAGANAHSATQAAHGTPASARPAMARRLGLAMGGGVAAIAAIAIAVVALGGIVDRTEDMQLGDGDTVSADSVPTGQAGAPRDQTASGQGASGSDSAAGTLASQTETRPAPPNRERSDSGARTQTREPAPVMPAPATTARSAEADALEAELRALARLDTIARALHPDVITEDGARRAVTMLGTLLPDLRSARDSVRAELNLANAFFFLQRIPEACATLRAARGLAGAASRADIDAQLDALGCS